MRLAGRRPRVIGFLVAVAVVHHAHRQVGDAGLPNVGVGPVAGVVLPVAYQLELGAGEGVVVNAVGLVGRMVAVGALQIRHGNGTARATRTAYAACTVRA